jgi:hypothetical protein
VCNRCTATSKPTNDAPGELVPKASTPPFKPPRRWLPDPVSRPGAVFYAVGGAAVWEGVLYVAHHMQVVITWV